MAAAVRWRRERRLPDAGGHCRARRGGAERRTGRRARTSLAEKPTTNVAAYDAFLRGEELSQGLAVRDPVQPSPRDGHTTQAVTLDPTFLQAWVQLSRTGRMRTNVPGMSERHAECVDARLSARRTRPDRPETRLAMGTYLRVVKEDPTRRSNRSRSACRHSRTTSSCWPRPRPSNEPSGDSRTHSLTHNRRPASIRGQSVAASVLARTYRDLAGSRKQMRRTTRTLSLAPGTTASSRAGRPTVSRRGPGLRATASRTHSNDVSVKDLIVRFATTQEMMWVLPDDLRNQVVSCSRRISTTTGACGR